LNSSIKTSITLKNNHTTSSKLINQMKTEKKMMITRLQRVRCNDMYVAGSLCINHQLKEDLASYRSNLSNDWVSGLGW
jgi:hypothetical protein